MLLVIGVISIALIVLGAVKDMGDTEMEGFVICVGIVGFIVSLIVSAFMLVSIVDGRVIDSKILMYEEENTRIQTEISTVVNTYLEHEKGTYEAITPDNVMFYATIYPELKSNELAQQQIQIYLNNNNDIKSLKLKKIGISNCKWWLYFGG